MPITRHQASSSNIGDEDTLQQLLQVVTSLQEKSEEQTRLNAKAVRRHEEEERGHEEALRSIGKCELELREQLNTLKTVAKHSEPPPPHMIWGQPFSKQIDNMTISSQFREIMVDPFDDSQDLQAKWPKVADLFDIKQIKNESLKQYLAYFNSGERNPNDSKEGHSRTLGKTTTLARSQLSTGDKSWPLHPSKGNPDIDPKGSLSYALARCSPTYKATVEPVARRMM
ncbi:hypothetical protein CR513_47746, partial [Mucuna pruriens]